MQKKYYLLFICMIILVIAIGCIKQSPSPIKEGPVSHYYWKTPVEWCEINASNCVSNEVSDNKGNFCKEYCFMKSALDFDNPNTCEKMTIQSGEISKDKCYILLAKKLNKLEFCEKVIKDIGMHSKDECLQELAVLRNDSSLCEAMKLQDHNSISTGSKDFYPFSKDACFFSLAFNTNYIELCEKISNDGWGFGSKPYANNNLIRWGSKDACKIWQAAKNIDINICKSIQETHLTDPESCIISVAVYNNEPAICENIQGKRLVFADYIKMHSKNECYFKVGTVFSSVETCNKMTDESTPLILENKHGPIYTKSSCINGVESSLRNGHIEGQRSEEAILNYMWN
jgi:hypothetical protein